MELEMDKLIAEATQALNDLVKSEQAVYEQELKKSQGAQAPATSTPATQAAPASTPATTTEVKKNESSSSSSSAKKAEDSGYENMSPEASESSKSSSSSPASDSSGSASPAPEEASVSSSGSPESSSGSSDDSSSNSSNSSSGSSNSSSSDSSGSADEDHVGQMLSELDDEKLQHLYMKAKSELMARMHRDESPSQPQEQPEQQSAMAMSEKVKELEGKLAKSETEKDNLKKAAGALIDLTDKFTRRPVKKAVTDVKFVERGGESLTKAEGMSEGELKKHINSISKDYSKLSKFSSEERMTLMDYVAGRSPRAEAVKILSK